MGVERGADLSRVVPDIGQAAMRPYGARTLNAVPAQHSLPHLLAHGHPLLGADVLRRIAYFPRSRRAAEYVLMHAVEPVRLKDVAAAVCMQEAAFSRFFAAKTGMTFCDFVRLVKIGEAIKRIAASDCTVGELSGDLGFQSTSTFVRSFKAVMGCSPSAYKRNLLENGLVFSVDTTEDDSNALLLRL